MLRVCRLRARRGFAERELMAGRDLLIENNFEDESYEPMRNLLEKYGCDAITVRF